MTGQPYLHYLDAGAAYLPADRLDEGLMAGHDGHRACGAGGTQPGVPGRLGRLPRARAAERIKEFNIKGQPQHASRSCRAAISSARCWVFSRRSLKLLLMEHPTRGLDIESIEYIWGLLLERTRQGTAIMFASADLDELLDRSDRILVFFGGRVTAALEPRTTTVEQLGELIGGKGL